MNRQLFTLLLVSASVIVLAEPIPNNYYKNAYGKKDSVLKTALHNIIYGGERYEYGNTTYHTGYTDPNQKGELNKYGTWQAFYLTDRRPDGAIWDMYSYHNRYFVSRGTSASCMEIEHCFPKSWWGGYGNETNPQEKYHMAYCDLHHLNPSDKPANTNKSNYPPHNLTKGDKFDNGSFRMQKVTEIVDGSPAEFFAFEPADEYKGDFARAWFYIATAYEDFEWDTKYMDNASYLEFQPWLIATLLEWHRNDPVSKKEVNRMNRVSNIQHNRNPFIDYPELVEYIWGNKQGKEVDFHSLTCTLDDTYIFQPEYSYLYAYYPKNMTPTACTPYWENLGEGLTYTVKMYAKKISGTGDTIAWIPRVGYYNDELDPMHCKNCEVSTTVSTTDKEGGSLRLKNGKTITIKGFAEVGKKANLVIRANQWGVNVSEDAHLEITIKTSLGSKLKDTTLTISGVDETDYRILLPEGAARVTLTSSCSGSGETNNPMLQSLYIVKDDYRVDTTWVEGFPQTTQNNSLDLNLGNAYKDKTLYYKVIVNAGKFNELRSNEKKFTMGVDVATPNVLQSDKYLRATTNGRTVCLEGLIPGVEVEAYSINGQLISRQKATDTHMFFNMPSTGIYIFRSSGESIEVMAN